MTTAGGSHRKRKTNEREVGGFLRGAPLNIYPDWRGLGMQCNRDSLLFGSLEISCIFDLDFAGGRGMKHEPRAERRPAAPRPRGWCAAPRARALRGRGRHCDPIVKHIRATWGSCHMQTFPTPRGPGARRTASKPISTRTSLLDDRTGPRDPAFPGCPAPKPRDKGITFWTRRPDLAITPNAGQPTPAPAHPGQPRNPTSDDTRPGCWWTRAHDPIKLNMSIK